MSICLLSVCKYCPFPHFLRKAPKDFTISGNRLPQIFKDPFGVLQQIALNVHKHLLVVIIKSSFSIMQEVYYIVDCLEQQKVTQHLKF